MNKFLLKPAPKLCRSERVWDSPTSIFATQNKQMYIRLHCLRMLWNLSTCIPKFENHFAIRTVRFQVQLEADGYFSAQKFSHLQPPQAGRVGTNLQFLNQIFQIRLQKCLWALPKPDIQHKNVLVPHLNGRWISKFLGEKFVSEKSSLIHLILHQTGTITSGFEGKKRK